MLFIRLVFCVEILEHASQGSPAVIHFFFFEYYIE